MSAIFKREFRMYFTTPLGYVVLFILFLVGGWAFTGSNLLSGSSDLAFVYDLLFYICLLIVLPVLTMQLLSEEKRQRTDQALLTAPVSLTGIALGKFLAALLVFAIGISITLIYAVVIAFQVVPDWLVIFGNYVGLLLLGGLIISIGLLISSFTESQFVAVIVTFMISFMIMMIDQLTEVFTSNTTVVAIVDFFSVYQRYVNFTVGSINYADVIFFLSMQALFVFLTVRSLDRKRWG
ncbi:MAG: ABC transporter permease subunit [Clostridia bacterium]|nr:ABC transporter permease subunit [Clostridia bacterium]